MNLDEILTRLRTYPGQLKIMEVCGTHTSSICKNGIRSLLSATVKLVSGPGCPVCVTPASAIDALIGLAREHTVLCFGDMFRVPGSRESLAEAKARGAQIRLMYSPFEVLTLAKAEPDSRFVVAAVGFETTAPAYAALLEALVREDVQNVSLYTALKTMPEVLDYVCAHEAVDAFLCPGHVSAVIGSAAYEPLCARYQKPLVIAGFEAGHILAAVYEIVRQSERGEPAVANLYPSVVRRDGQTRALALLDKYFDKTDAFWRGIGTIKNSGLTLKSAYTRFSTGAPVNGAEPDSLPPGCRCADVMLGRIAPDECPLFGGRCTPQHPMGACMVSAEGACGIWRRGGG